MNILIDINHPAHVHYFKNLYQKLIDSNHEVIVVSRNKEIEQELLSDLSIPFISRGKGAKSLIGKIFYHIYAVLYLFYIIKKHRIDRVISFMHPYAAQASWLAGVKSNIYSDTEHAKLHHKLTVPFAEKIYTPKCFKGSLGKNHVTFDSYMEFAYLHPNYYTPNPDIIKVINYNENKPIIIIRFVSWGAVHDRGFKGLTDTEKIKLVESLAKNNNVFISSENPLPSKIESYNLDINKSKIHDLLFYSNLFIGESATMASESAILGTPSIYINQLQLGYLEDLERKYKLVKNINSTNPKLGMLLEIARELLADKSLVKNRELLIKNSIDLSDFMYKEIIN